MRVLVTEWSPASSSQYEAEVVATAGPWMKLKRPWRRAHWNRDCNFGGEAGTRIRIIEPAPEDETL